jgi:Na+-driven multidrug efflux pump
MERFTPKQLALAGVATYLTSVLCGLAYFSYRKRQDPPGWIMDRPTPDLLRWLMGAGLILFMVSIIWGLARFIANFSRAKRV